MLSWKAPKDPDEVKEYYVEFGPLLTGGDTLVEIVACEVVVGDVVIDDSDIVAHGDTEAQDVRIWFSSGTLDEDCEVLTRVRTAGTRTYDQSCKLKIRKK